MSIADGMKDIVDNIEHSRTERIADVGEIRSAAQNMLGGIHGTRMALARETQDMLNEFHEARVESARETAKQLKKDVANIRIDANNLIHGFAEERLANGIELSRTLKSYHDERLVNGIELSRMLKSYHDGITQDVQQLMDPIKEDLAEAHAIWQSHVNHEHPYARPGLKTVHKVKTVHKATKAPRKEREKPKQSADYGLKEKVLKVINNSPKGITLTKAGKKIGVEWRTLIRPAKDLLKVGDVRKKDTYYFPT